MNAPSSVLDADPDVRAGVPAQAQVRPCTMNIGADIEGIDLSRELTPETVRFIHDALMAHQVVFFRDQHLSHEDHLRLGRGFGALAIHSGVAGLPDYPEVVAIHADASSRYVAGENWHSDLSCNAEPPMGSILYLQTVPPVGGDTLFASMYAAYDALSERMKTYLDGLEAVHDGELVYRRIIDDPTKRFPVNAHPVVRVHPVTGRKALFVNKQYTTHIVGMDRDESRAILAYLYEHCTDPAFQVRFRWEPRSVAFWDNRCTLHHAVWDYYPQVRSGFRVTIQGDKPIAATSGGRP
ncbi:taurine dioxygenase [Verticiella sediminum]|uniref:Taurine dioxygenase n=1 Tax=Verticiella sediminum TaxID=1247510 RepID=A0A556AVW7_9BURK|nr:TauD/TfdA family dioxygenase [Verticiella sediminum]TSH97103.1 taurine dioxygenase [Verticiella sediminum]